MELSPFFCQAYKPLPEPLSHQQRDFQITQHMQIPLSYADAIIGSAGANISYMRRTSGATITIQETRGVPGEMTVEILGGATQVQTAQQLIQVGFLCVSSGNACGEIGVADGSSTTSGDMFLSGILIARKECNKAESRQQLCMLDHFASCVA